jgi:hypothetical protein
MRLSEERIDFINAQALDALIDLGLIEIEGRERSVLVEMNRVALQDLAHEDRIDEEVRQMIAKMKRDIPEGSAEYSAIFLQKKEELATRDGYVL